MVHKYERRLALLNLLHTDLLKLKACRDQIRDRNKSHQGSEEYVRTYRLFVRMLCALIFFDYLFVRALCYLDFHKSAFQSLSDRLGVGL